MDGPSLELYIKSINATQNYNLGIGVDDTLLGYLYPLNRTGTEVYKGISSGIYGRIGDGYCFMCSPFRYNNGGLSLFMFDGKGGGLSDSTIGYGSPYVRPLVCFKNNDFNFELK